MHAPTHNTLVHMGRRTNTPEHSHPQPTHSNSSLSEGRTQRTCSQPMPTCCTQLTPLHLFASRLKLLLQNLCVATGVRAMPEGPRTPTASPKAARKTPKAVKPLTPAQPQPPLNLVSTLPAAAPEHEHPHFELATPTAPPPIFPHRIYSRKYPMRDLWDGRPPYAKSGHSEVFSSTVADAYATSQDAHLGHDPDVIFRNRARALGSFKIPPFAKLSGYVDKPVTTMSLDYQPISKDDREQALQPRLNVNKFLEAQHRAVMPGGR